MKRSILLLFILCLIPVLSFAGAPLDERVGEYYTIQALGSPYSWGHWMHAQPVRNVQVGETVNLRGTIVGLAETTNPLANEGATLSGGINYGSNPLLETSLYWSAPGSYQNQTELQFTNPFTNYYELEIFIDHLGTMSQDDGFWDSETSYFELNVRATELGVGSD